MVEGTSLQSRYRLDHRIAIGGMGAVYEGVDERLDRRVAVKVLKVELAQDPRFVERFRREARAVASLSHRNIATVYDYGEDGDAYFIVMEYAPGEDLARLLRSSAPLPPDRAVQIATQMCAALAHAHSAGIVHRDIKPANVMVGPGDRVKVTDFGIARAAGDATLTATGSILGTAQYLSPEQAGGGLVGPPCDIYATGIVLFEMLTGTVPFTGDSAVAVAMRHISEPVPAPSRRNPDVPPELDRIVAMATAKDPRDRFPDGAAMARALEGPARPIGDASPIVAGADAPTLENGSPETRTMDGSAWPVPGRGWDARRLGRAVLIAFALLLLLAAGAVAWRLATDDQQPAREGEPRQRQGAPAEESPSPEETATESFEITERIIGSNVKDTERVLSESGFHVETVPVESEEEKDTIVDVDPDVGSTVMPGVDTITLYFSTGKADDYGGPDGGPPDEPPGQEKKDEEGDD
jgi:eukaryotic-like serine/threonine-protein kinase